MEEKTVSSLAVDKMKNDNYEFGLMIHCYLYRYLIILTLLMGKFGKK